MKKWLLSLPAAALAGGWLGFQYACRRMEDSDWDSPEALKKTMLDALTYLIVRKYLKMLFGDSDKKETCLRNLEAALKN